MTCIIARGAWCGDRRASGTNIRPDWARRRCRHPPAAHERQARRPVATVRRQRAAAGLSRDGPTGRLDLELRRASLSA